jgi:hypothetical protein
VVNTEVVPEPSERWTGMMSWSGSSRSGFSAWICGIVVLGDAPLEDVADRAAIQDQAVELLVVEGDRDRAEHDRELDRVATTGFTSLLEGVVAQVALRGTEVDGARAGTARCRHRTRSTGS